MNITTSFGQKLEVAETPNGRSVSRGKLLFNEDGSIAKEYWSQDGVKHRDDGPATILYSLGRVFPGETRTFEELARAGEVYAGYWLRNSKLHRDDGPALIVYFADGSIYSEYWYLDDKKHRDDGPAFIAYSKGRVPGDTRTFEELERDGAVKSAEWYRNGKLVTRFT